MIEYNEELEKLEQAKRLLDSGIRGLKSLQVEPVEPNDPDPVITPDPDPPRTPNTPLPRGDVFEELGRKPFASELPAFPSYGIPRLEDCDWVIREGRAHSLKGLSVIGDEYPIGAAYRASMAAGHGPLIKIGVEGDGGVATICSGWGWQGNRCVAYKDPSGQFRDVDLQIVGLSDDAEVSIPQFETRWGSPGILNFFNIGIRGASNSFICSGHDVSNFVMDGCWYLANPGQEGGGSMHSSGLHIRNWNTCVIRRHKWRGKRPEDPGLNFREHSFYLKNGLTPESSTWVIENELKGGNRSGMQIRPGADADTEPQGDVVVAGNYSSGFGWNHNYSEGGAVITVWSNPTGKTFITENDILDARYACIALIAQETNYKGADRNFRNARGFPIGEAWLYDNRVENSHNGHPPGGSPRTAVVCMGVEKLHLGPIELQQGAQLALSNRWGSIVHNIQNGEVMLEDESLVQADIIRWLAQPKRWHAYTEAEKRAMLV